VSTVKSAGNASIFNHYKKISSRLLPLQLKEERKLLSLAKKGNVEARDKILLHVIGFLIFRIETTLFLHVRLELGEDVLQECILFAHKKIDTYKQRYKNKKGLYIKVYFRSYIWKGITGVMLNYVRQNYDVVNKETCKAPTIIY